MVLKQDQNHDYKKEKNKKRSECVTTISNVFIRAIGLGIFVQIVFPFIVICGEFKDLCYVSFVHLLMKWIRHCACTHHRHNFSDLTWLSFAEFFYRSLNIGIRFYGVLVFLRNSSQCISGFFIFTHDATILKLLKTN